MSIAAVERERTAEVATPIDRVAHQRRRDTRRAVATISALCAALFVVSAVNLLLGRFTVTVPDFFRILGGEVIPPATFIVMEDKLPRTIAGILCGLAFGAAGALLQSLLRNPLASPDIIGISHGASAGAVLAIVGFGASGLAVSGAAFAGAFAVVIVAMVAGRRDLTGGQVILIGIACAAASHALISYLLTRTSIQTAADSVRWLAGSLSGSSWDRITIMAGLLVVLAPATYYATHLLGRAELGPDLSSALGVPARRARTIIITVCVGLTAAATATVGPLAFVALMSGPIARRLSGGRRSVAGAALTGAIIVVLSDFVAANLLGDVVVPVGVITGGLGAIFLVYLLTLDRKARTL